MKNLKYLIKVPKTISVVYCANRRVIFIKKNDKTSLIRLKLKLLFLNNNTLYVTDKKFFSFSNIEKKNLKSLRGFTFSQIVKSFHKVSYTFFKKLKLIGVSYKVFDKTLTNLNLIEFKLGYSHSIFLRPSKDVSVICYKSNILFVQSNSYNKLSEVAAMIRNYKIPEVYKGKGILYQNETVKLKQGKKI
jgi:large subunit ribosomal protein L6